MLWRREENLAKLNKANQETQMSVFMYQYCNDSKTTADSEQSESKRFIHFMLEKYNHIQVATWGYNTTTYKS